MVERGDKVLLWLKILTLLVGGIGTLAVVFLADVILERVSAAPMSVELEATVEMSEVAELHHWAAYKATTVQNDFEANYHVEKALALATDTEHQSLLDGLLREHLPSGHFIHTEVTLIEILESGNAHEPELSFSPLHARLAYLLLAEGNIGEAQEQVEHLVTLAAALEKEQGQKILDALTTGDTDTASLLLAEFAGEEVNHHD
jgi:hypothetical protein